MSKKKCKRVTYLGDGAVVHNFGLSLGAELELRDGKHVDLCFGCTVHHRFVRGVGKENYKRDRTISFVSLVLAMSPTATKRKEGAACSTWPSGNGRMPSVASGAKKAAS